MPFAHPELLEPIFAAGVTRRGCALELNSEGGSGGPTSVCSDPLFDACGPSWDEHRTLGRPLADNTDWSRHL